MVSPDTIAAVALQLASGAVAGYGAWRCIELQRYGKDPRLRALAWFFGLFAASVLAHAAWEVQVDQAFRSAGRMFERNGTARPGGFQGFLRPAGTENVTILLLVHHLLMAGSLGVGVVAFGRRHPVHVHNLILLAPLAALSSLVPLLLSLQAALTLYLAVRAWLNHMERKTPGALQVALGFLLFFIGHLTFVLMHRPGRGRQGIGDVLTLVGIILLIQVLPGRR